MRDINRIEPFMNLLAKVWELNPDLRFGQLITILKDCYCKDISLFNMEEFHWLNCMIEFLEEKGNNEKLIGDMEVEFLKYNNDIVRRYK